MAGAEAPIFRDNDFGFVLTDVAEARQMAGDNARVQAEMLVDELERVRQAAERNIGKAEREAAFFEAYDDETILRGLQYVFDRGRELEASGLPAVEVAVAMRNEIPDLSIIGGIILEQKTWGYRLHQIGIGAAFASFASKEQQWFQTYS